MQPFDNRQPYGAHPPGGYRQDRSWADTYTPEISRIIRLCGDLICAPSEIVVNVAPDREDREECTDYVISIAAGAIACRLRRANYGYRDWTVRHSRPGGIKTEEAKLRAGWGRWYIYGWTVNGKIPHWMLIDLNRVRQNRALDRGAILSNYDGTKFRAIRHDALEDCLARGYIDGTWLPWSDEDVNDVEDVNDTSDCNVSDYAVSDDVNDYVSGYEAHLSAWAKEANK